MYRPATGDITRCIRCGTCCLKGGPVLHHEDKHILLSGEVGHGNLITVRKGELAYNPLKEGLEHVPDELIKVAGKGDGWACCFYNEEVSACMIYGTRFLECRLLKCWDPSDLIRVIGKDTIKRADIINSNDPIMEIIELHERDCPAGEVNALISGITSAPVDPEVMSGLSALVHRDISIRSYAVSELGLDIEFELFVFGRPMVKIIADRGLSVRLPEDSPGNRSERNVKRKKRKI
jgi:Fe-S-cluster containining protein